MASTVGAKWKWNLRRASVIGLGILLATALVSAERNLKNHAPRLENTDKEAARSDFVFKFVNFLSRADEPNYRHAWPPLKFGWKLVVGSIIGFFGAAFGSVGAVGGGGIFVPMLILVVRFDEKSSTAISKCMITAIAASSVYDKLKMRHPTLDMPIVDYDLALLFQPMLLLGVSIGVTFNVIFPNWMITVLLIILFLGTATKAFFKGVETWKKETIITEAAPLNVPIGEGSEVEYTLLPSGLGNGIRTETQAYEEAEVSFLQNIYWKEFSLLVFVWIAFIALQISMKYTVTCSTGYWVLNLLQIPVSVVVTLHEAVCLYKGKRVIASKGEQVINWRVHQLVLYCTCGILAGVVGGLLGLGGGFVLAPLFLELGVPPQVSSATATFAMAFSSSMSVVEYYLLDRFPVPYALYFVVVATIAAFMGQLIVRRLIIVVGRASFIIFILVFTIFVSAISLGGVGISNIIRNAEHRDYMGFYNLCKYRV